MKIREWLSLAIFNQAFWLGTFGLGVPFKIFTARLGLSVWISQMHFQKKIQKSRSISLSLSLTLCISLFLYLSLSIYLYIYISFYLSIFLLFFSLFITYLSSMDSFFLCAEQYLNRCFIFLIRQFIYIS